VLGVCRRVLRHEADAEDAFQATFLVLARKAAAVVPRSQVANWLHGTAHNTARKARAMRGKRRVKESQAPARAAATDEGRDAHEALDQELSALPGPYRAAVVQCDLEGRTLREAARQLGCPLGTVASRLARGRALLARRLAQRGVTLSGAALAAAVPPSLTAATLRAAAGAADVSTQVAALTEGVVRSMLLNKLKGVAAVLALAAVVTAPALGWLRQPARAGDEAATVTVDGPKEKADADPKALLERALKEAGAVKAASDEELWAKVALLRHLAVTQAHVGDKAGAAKTLVLARETAEAIKDEFRRVTSVGDVAELQAMTGDTEAALKTVESIKVEEKGGSRWVPAEYRGRVQAAIARNQLRAGDFAAALRTAEKGTSETTKEELLEQIGLAQAKAKDFAAAAKTAAALKYPGGRAHVLTAVARGQAGAGDRAAALKTLGELRRLGEDTPKEHAPVQGYLYAQAASAQAELGDAAAALAWIDKLATPTLRAQALDGLATGLAKRLEAEKPKKEP
jgi:RNA polymerase sigma factor (sigma-70 family)